MTGLKYKNEELICIIVVAYLHFPISNRLTLQCPPYSDLYSGCPPEPAATAPKLTAVYSG